MKNRITAILLATLLLCCGGGIGEACAKKKSKKQTTTTTTTVKKKTTPYEKLFKDKQCKSVEGLVKLHKVGDKVYIELPKRLLDREMLLGSSVETNSDNGEAMIGQKPHEPLHVVFTQIDSTVQIRYVYRNSITDPQEEEIERAIVKSNIPAILASFEIKAQSPDSSAVVFDATKFFVSELYDIDPFDPYGNNTYFGWMARTSRFKSDRSYVSDVAAFEDNFSILSTLTYEVSYRALGMFLIQENEPFTATMRRTFMLLPEEPMRPRTADPRIGIFNTPKMKFASSDSGMEVVYYANRWRLEPKDTEAYSRGELTEPVKPIIFYIDNSFPSQWVKYISEGVEQWNEAFEAIGFKNVMRAVPFPENNPEFDANNMKYSCIFYSPDDTENAMGPSWVDPRTGEILNASVFLHHNMLSLIFKWRLIQTAAADKDVRGPKLPEDVLGDAIRYVTAHEVGHTLGLMHNMAASAAFPVDSLRSPSFTQKYGTTPSIMDYARFNYVAQPGDKERGVKLTPPRLGVYDYYAIKWLYTPILSARTTEEEVPVLDGWISEHDGDPMYRYGKQQVRSFYDPSSQTEDLGDDAVKATRYGVENLKYVLANMNEWLREGDRSYDLRTEVYLEILQQLRMYIGHVKTNIGGIYLNERYAGDKRQSYVSVPREKQKEAVKYLLELQADTHWMDNEEITRNMGIMGPIGDYLQNYIISNVLLHNISEVKLSALKSTEKRPYTEEECMDDILEFIMKSATERRSVTDIERKGQLNLLAAIIKNARVNIATGKSRTAFGLTDDDPLAWLDAALYRSGGFVSQRYEAGEAAGFGYQTRVKFTEKEMAHIYYGALLKMRRILSSARYSGDEKTRMHYGYMLDRIDKALKVE